MNTPSTHSQQPDAMTGRTDLGRRLAARREALGLSRDELGRRCGADGTYITYLEEHAASPAIGTLVRVADALGLTVDDLTGASAHRVAGRPTARKEEAFSVMLRTDGVRTFDDVRPAFQELRERAVRCAAVSALLLEALGGLLAALEDGCRP